MTIATCNFPGRCLFPKKSTGYTTYLLCVFVPPIRQLFESVVLADAFRKFCDLQDKESRNVLWRAKNHSTAHGSTPGQRVTGFLFPLVDLGSKSAMAWQFSPTIPSWKTKGPNESMEPIGTSQPSRDCEVSHYRGMLGNPRLHAASHNML